MTRLRFLLKLLVLCLPFLAAGWSVYLAVLCIQPIVAGAVLIASATAMLGLIVSARMPRLSKGLSLVGVAVISTTLYEMCIKSQIGRVTAESPEWISAWTGLDQIAVLSIGANTLATLVSFMNLACAGAGGSIIAVEGDRTSIESPLPENPAANSAISLSGTQTDYLPLLQSLSQKVNSQTVAINTLEGALLCLSKQQSNLKWILVTFAAVTGLLLVLLLLTVQH